MFSYVSGRLEVLELLFCCLSRLGVGIFCVLLGIVDDLCGDFFRKLEEEACLKQVFSESFLHVGINFFRFRNPHLAGEGELEFPEIDLGQIEDVGIKVLPLALKGIDFPFFKVGFGGEIPFRESADQKVERFDAWLEIFEIDLDPRLG